jgi:DNA-binding CsgD family transcriptional regulator
VTTAAPVGPTTTSGGPVPSLNAAEYRVLEGRARGLSYMQIAGQLHYTYSSTVNVGSRVIDKLGARDMAHAVFLAVQAGLLDPRRRHGDHAGFAAHRYRGEEPCEACWEGERAYRRERRAARKARQGDAA